MNLFMWMQFSAAFAHNNSKQCNTKQVVNIKITKGVRKRQVLSRQRSNIEYLELAREEIALVKCGKSSMCVLQCIKNKKRRWVTKVMEKKEPHQIQCDTKSLWRMKGGALTPFTRRQLKNKNLQSQRLTLEEQVVPCGKRRTLKCTLSCTVHPQNPTLFITQLIGKPQLPTTAPIKKSKCDTPLPGFKRVTAKGRPVRNVCMKGYALSKENKKWAGLLDSRMTCTPDEGYVTKFNGKEKKWTIETSKDLCAKACTLGDLPHMDRYLTHAKKKLDPAHTFEYDYDGKCAAGGNFDLYCEEGEIEVFRGCPAAKLRV